MEAAPLLQPRGDGAAATAAKGWRARQAAVEWWVESKKLWRIVGPAIFQRIALYGVNVVSQAFIGHLGDLELAAFSIAATVVAGFNFGFLSQLKNWVTAVTAGITLVIHVVATYLLVQHFQLGIVGAVVAADLSWWLVVLGQFLYVVGGGCPLSWKGFSMEAFADFWEFIKLSSASGVMLCLENWYYRVLVLLTGYLNNAEIAVDALSICLTINGWELMIPLGFLAATGVRVANELGAGSGKGARFAIVVSVTTSVLIGLFFWCVILYFNDQFALLFTSSEVVLSAVHNLSLLLAFTVLLNSVQPVLSGVAVGSGWQALVAYVNIGSYYLVGVPLGVILGWPLRFGVGGIWSGLIGGTAVQTLVLAYLTTRCDWDEEAKKASTRMRVWAGSK
ncbi:unnamed protein product [Urochloa decumbens]|uniref:Protein DETOXIFICATION n=1 Tax=Urochloa decumbens TaxID=240449 RepID=A0ABC9BS73_9POAL